MISKRLTRGVLTFNASLTLVNTQSVGFTLGLVMISSNIGGYTKRSIVSAMVFAASVVYRCSALVFAPF